MLRFDGITCLNTSLPEFWSPSNKMIRTKKTQLQQKITSLKHKMYFSLYSTTSRWEVDDRSHHHHFISRLFSPGTGDRIGIKSPLQPYWSNKTFWGVRYHLHKTYSRCCSFGAMCSARDLENAIAKIGCGNHSVTVRCSVEIEKSRVDTQATVSRYGGEEGAYDVVWP